MVLLLKITLEAIEHNRSNDIFGNNHDIQSMNDYIQVYASITHRLLKSILRLISIIKSLKVIFDILDNYT